MRVRQMQNLCTEIYKTLSNLNPQYMQELFERNSSSYSTRSPKGLKIPRVNQVSYGSPGASDLKEPCFGITYQSVLNPLKTCTSSKRSSKLGRALLVDVTIAFM